MKVTKTNRKWVCAFCGSDELAEKAWISLNHDVVIDEDCYVKYIDCADEMYWCDKCNEEATPMPYEDYKAKTDEEDFEDALLHDQDERERL